DARIVRSKTVLAMTTVDEGIGKAGDVSRCLPHLRMHEDRGVESLDVVARVDHRTPPAILQVLLELDAERTVVPDGAEASVDLGGLEDESAPLCERHELVHEAGIGHQIRSSGSTGWVTGAGEDRIGEW